MAGNEARGPLAGLDLSPLDEAALARLEALVSRCLRAEEERVDEALHATLRFLPPLLRKRAGTMLFPERRR